MRVKTSVLVLLTSISMLAATGTAHADPKFEYKPVEVTKKVVWKVAANLGLIFTTGNASQLSFAAGGFVSRNDGKNMFTLSADGAYAKATTVSAADANLDGFIGPSEITRTDQVSTALWNAKLRYDRFLTANNLLYLAAVAAGNKPGGKNVVAGAQIGYARQLYKSEWHLLNLEGGYDYSYVNYVAEKTPDVQLHSLRLFVGYTLTLSKDTSLAAEVEALCNLNPVTIGGVDAGVFQATRVNSKASLTTRIWKMIAFRLTFSAKYDNAPPPAAAFALPYEAGFAPRAERLDTITDASIIVNFL